MMIVYFIRHGESVGNKENRFRGRHDFDLNNNGVNVSFFSDDFGGHIWLEEYNSLIVDWLNNH